MAVVSGKIAARYARALFELYQPDQVAEVKAALLIVSKALEDDEQLFGILQNPAVALGERRELLRSAALVARGSEDSIFLDFFSLLLENHRLEAVDEIAREFERMVNRLGKILALKITSAFEINEVERSKILEDLKARFGAALTIEWYVDPSILGGLVIRSDDVLLDGSVLGGLEKLRTTTLKGAGTTIN